MARLEDIPQPTRDAVLAVPCPSFDTQPFVVGPVLSVFAPFSSASFGRHRQHSSCRQDIEDDRGLAHMPPAPHSGGNMLAHSGPAS